MTYLCCLAHVSPHETLREMWNVYRYRMNAKINYQIQPEELARIIGTVIQNVPKRKQVVIVRPFLVPQLFVPPRIFFWSILPSNTMVTGVADCLGPSCA